MTAATLTPNLRSAYGLTFGTREQIAYYAGLTTLRKTLPRVPDALRFVLNTLMRSAD